MKRILITTFVLVLSSLAVGQDYLDVTPEYGVKFPDDFYYKNDYRVQWWYFTGHLFDKKGREFGYELTFFVVNVQKRDYKSRFGVNRIYISHFAISDIAAQKFHFSEQSDAGAYGFAGADDSRLKVWVGEHLLDGSANNIHLKASDKEKSIELQLAPVKPMVLNGGKGYSRKSEESPLIASIYFSCTHLDTNGTVRIGDNVYHVRGKSWFDREISTRSLSEKQAGWDWFAIQLDDNREIMLYRLRNKDGSIDPYSSGTFVFRDGRYRHLSRDAFSVQVLSHYISEKTASKYPSQWEIRVPSERLSLKVTPLLEDQEILAYGSTGNRYWEGACKVEGAASGRAYVEMTGY